MTSVEIESALANITAEDDPAVKHLKLASLVSAAFRERGIELVVVGGSAIEFYTDGSYVSGDLDLCLLTPARLALRTRQDIMGSLHATGGPRSWQVAGQYVDVLGELETLARIPLKELQAPYGTVKLAAAEELLVERVLISVYPHRNDAAEACARKLIAVSLSGHVELDWREVQRLAARPEYGILPELQQLVGSVANELGRPSPCDPQRPAH